MSDVARETTGPAGTVPQEKLLRIGELSRRVGVSVESLRAWERRYGLLAPSRTPGGFRLYGENDVARVVAMRNHLDHGLSAAEAARLALAEQLDTRPSTPGPVTDSRDLAEALDRYDEVAAHRALDGLLATLTLDVVLADVLMPYLHDLGERWERGEVSVAQEHFASNLVHGRLTALTRFWDRGEGRRALLACAEGERHDLPLIGFGLALRTHGWRIGYLGADTPVVSLVEAARTLAPDAVVVSGTVSGVFDAIAPPLREVTLHAPLFLAGASAGPAVARRANATLLDDDVVLAAETLAAHCG